MVHKRDVLISCLSFVSRLDWLIAIEVMKQHNVAIVNFIQELEWWFVVQDIINANSVIYPQFWVQLKLNISLRLIFPFKKFITILASRLAQNNCSSHLCLMNIVGAACIFFQAHYASQLPFVSFQSILLTWLVWAFRCMQYLFCAQSPIKVFCNFDLFYFIASNLLLQWTGFSRTGFNSPMRF